MIGFTSRGDYTATTQFLKRLAKNDLYANLDRYGKRGVAALSAATPAESGRTAQAWRYRVIKDSKRPGIEWYNTNAAGGVSVAVLIQYGHGTGTGGYVSGRDFINPAMRPVFDEIADAVWKEVTR